MRLYEIFDTSDQVLKDIARIATNMHNADFWITRRGLQTAVGNPTKSFHHESFGVKILNQDINPNDIFDHVKKLHDQGHFSDKATGLGALTHIRLQDIENIPIPY